MPLIQGRILREGGGGWPHAPFLVPETIYLYPFCSFGTHSQFLEVRRAAVTHYSLIIVSLATDMLPTHLISSSDSARV